MVGQAVPDSRLHGVKPDEIVVARGTGRDGADVEVGPADDGPEGLKAFDLRDI